MNILKCNRQQLDAIMKGKRYIPCISRRKECPLTLIQHLTYSLLVYRTDRGQGSSQKLLAKRIGVSRNLGIGPAIKNLVDLGLAKKAEEGYLACEPGDTKKTYFALKSPPKGEDAPPWTKSFATFRYFPLASQNDLSTANNALYWLLVSLSDQSGSKKAQTVSGMASLLGTSEKHTRMWFGKLVALGLVAKNGNGYQLLNPKEQLHQWVDKEKETSHKKVLSSMIWELAQEMVGHAAGVRPAVVSVLNNHAEKMLAAGYSWSRIVPYWSKTIVQCYDTYTLLEVVLHDWEPLFVEAEEIHNKSGKAPTSEGLLTTNTDRMLRKKKDQKMMELFSRP